MKSLKLVAFLPKYAEIKIRQACRKWVDSLPLFYDWHGGCRLNFLVYLGYLRYRTERYLKELWRCIWVKP